MLRARFSALAAAAVLAGCSAGPNYTRPAVPAPAAFRAAEPQPADPQVSLGDLKWFEVFKDGKLQDLEQTALARNYDLREAFARVDAARANLGIVRSQQFPNAAASAGISTVRSSRDGAVPLPPAFALNQNRTFGGATLNLLSFEVDIWGRLRRATEAARAQLLSADENRKAVITTMVADVATNYFQRSEERP